MSDKNYHVRRFLFTGLMFVFIAMMLFVPSKIYAQEFSRDLLYTGSALDDSGEITLQRANFSVWNIFRSKYITVPNDTIFRVLKETSTEDFSLKVRFKTESGYSSDTFRVNKESVQLTELSAEEIHSSENRDLFNNYFLGSLIYNGYALLMLALFCVSVFVIYTKIAKRPYRLYYEKKQSEHPWLKTWLEKNYDTVKILGKGDALMPKVIGILTPIALYLVIGFFFNRWFSSLLSDGVITYNYNALDFFEIQKEGLVAFPVLLAICWLVGFVAWILFKGTPGRVSISYDGIVPNSLLTLECPSCGCPHSWEMVYENYRVLSLKYDSSTYETKHWEEDQSGNKVLGSERTETNTYYYTFFTLHYQRDFVCHSCQHTVHEEERDQYPRTLNHVYSPDEIANMAYGDAHFSAWDFYVTENKLETVAKIAAAKADAEIKAAEDAVRRAEAQEAVMERIRREIEAEKQWKKDHPVRVWLGRIIPIILGLLYGLCWAYLVHFICVKGFSLPLTSFLNLYFLITFGVIGFISFAAWKWKKIGWAIVMLLISVLGAFVFFAPEYVEPLFAAEQTVTAQTSTITQDVNFRDAPGTDSNVIRSLSEGDEVTITGEVQDGWLPIEHNGDAGWVSAEFVE
jgi:hypothetical protein